MPSIIKASTTDIERTVALLAKYSFEDETSIDPLKLLSQYRDICENLGGLRASGSRPPRQLEERLARVEAELQARLWLSSGGKERKDGKEGVLSQSSAISPQSSVIGQKSSVQDPGPRTQDCAPHQHPTPNTQHLPTGAAEVYSDGACSGNPGPGGYGTLVRMAGQLEKVLTGGKARTTNNEMEMTGAVEGLKAAAAMGAREVTVFSDSEYLVKGMNDWMKGWLRNGWKTRTGHPVKNRELWEELHRLSQGRTVNWKWVAGHSGHPENERCNELAVAAAKQAAARR